MQIRKRYGRESDHHYHVSNTVTGVLVMMSDREQGKKNRIEVVTCKMRNARDESRIAGVEWVNHNHNKRVVGNSSSHRSIDRDMDRSSDG